MARRRPLESYNKTWLGFVALAVVGVLVAASLLVKVLGFGYTHYTAEFLQAASLRAGNPITIAGIEVGSVSSIKLAGDHVEAGLKVRNNVPLGKDTRAVIKVMTILGSRYLELVPDGPGSLPGKTISLAHTEVPYDLQSLLEDATTTFEQADSDQFAQSLAVLGKQLEGVPPLVPQAMANLHTLAAITAVRRDQLGALLKSTQRVANTLRRQQTNLGNLMDQGQDLIGHLVAREATFHAMLAALTQLVDQLDKIVVNHRPMLDELFTNLHELTNMVGQHDDLLRNLLQAAPVPLRGLTNATGYGPVVEFNLANGLAIDSWMCAISGRAKEFGMIQYFKDCK
ncbi:MCE family protein [Mycobacterium branderi]|uniref:MCE family protein n=1 Tax=Mycobacterium branderi TaxID=43348 RepID=A0A7I7W0Z1_9MYCO|nr:MlaD family protein [Mycobacterium branderi]MCV7236121.1 MCE family protein [Mycobacterium branderi]ORA32007.1 mammalian cell entry protein [Mycobacterium branderi]BBZ10850.1 putative MCE family protein [Mycobacterium branderi]